MNLSDAKAQVEREQPHLTGTAKIQAIKALRAQAPPAESSPEESAPGPIDQANEQAGRKSSHVGEAWAVFAFVFIGMRVISYFVWGSISGSPHWYDALYAVALIAAITELISAYRHRSPGA